jgi:hypothetical protein
MINNPMYYQDCEGFITQLRALLDKAKFACVHEIDDCDDILVCINNGLLDYNMDLLNKVLRLIYENIHLFSAESQQPLLKNLENKMMLDGNRAFLVATMRNASPRRGGSPARDRLKDRLERVEDKKLSMLRKKPSLDTSKRPYPLRSLPEATYNFVHNSKRVDFYSPEILPSCEAYFNKIGNRAMVAKIKTESPKDAAVMCNKVAKGLYDRRINPVVSVEKDDGKRLPLGWTFYYDDQGDIYYYNVDTGATQWRRPV